MVRVIPTISKLNTEQAKALWKNLNAIGITIADLNKDYTQEEADKIVTKLATLNIVAITKELPTLPTTFTPPK